MYNYTCNYNDSYTGTEIHIAITMFLSHLILSSTNKRFSVFLYQQMSILKLPQNFLVFCSLTE